MARKPKIVPRKNPGNKPVTKPQPTGAGKSAKPVKPKKPVVVPRTPKPAKVAPTSPEPVADTPAPASTPAPTPPSPASERDRQAAQVFAYATNLHRQGDHEQAIEAYCRALSLSPGNAEIYSNMGICLRAQGKLAAAVSCYRRALVLQPDDAVILTNLGNVLRDMDDFQPAISALGRALTIAPNMPRVLFNMALALRDVGEVDKAIACLAKAMVDNPEDIACHVEIGFSFLMNGDLARGFAHLEWRTALAEYRQAMPQVAMWDGKPLAGKTILVYQDGGLSDAVLFARYISKLKDFGANVVLECHAKAADLLSTVQGVDKICIAGKQRPDFHVHAPLMSLSHLLGGSDQILSEKIPYIKVGQAQPVNLPPKAGLQTRTGLCWAPDMVRANARDRSCRLEDLLDLVTVPGVTAFSLQGGQRAGDLATVSCPALITDLSTQIENLADLAGAISQLDLVICVDGVTAHIAGALGKPTWVLLPFTTDWHWNPLAQTSVWYPHMRLFRQPRPGDWASVVDEVKQALFEHTSQQLTPTRA